MKKLKRILDFDGAAENRDIDVTVHGLLAQFASIRGARTVGFVRHERL
jgi:hypothetical protein